MDAIDMGIGAGLLAVVGLLSVMALIKAPDSALVTRLRATGRMPEPGELWRMDYSTTGYDAGAVTHVENERVYFNNGFSAPLTQWENTRDTPNWPLWSRV
jgi:hypothetical protein